jgi:hypothetical protein
MSAGRAIAALAAAYRRPLGLGLGLDRGYLVLSDSDVTVSDILTWRIHPRLVVLPTCASAAALRRDMWGFGTRQRRGGFQAPGRDVLDAPRGRRALHGGRARGRPLCQPASRPSRVGLRRGAPNLAARRQAAARGALPIARARHDARSGNRSRSCSHVRAGTPGWRCRELSPRCTADTRGTQSPRRTESARMHCRRCSESRTAAGLRARHVAHRADPRRAAGILDRMAAQSGRAALVVRALPARRDPAHRPVVGPGAREVARAVARATAGVTGAAAAAGDHETDE